MAVPVVQAPLAPRDGLRLPFGGSRGLMDSEEAVVASPTADDSRASPVSPTSDGNRRSSQASRGEVPRLRCDLAQEVAGLEQEEGLSADYLRHYCETDDLDNVTRLEIQVDSVAQSIELLGEHLRNLRQLRLTDSSVMCLRDLGAGLKHLEVLWMSRCGLQDIGGAGAVLPELREFYLPFNDVTDLTPIGSLECLEVLDVEGNAVGDPQEVAVLRMCPQLRELTLSGNPVSRDPTMPRQAIIDLLPQLTMLDDVPTDPTAASSSAPAPRDPDLDLEVEQPDMDLIAEFGMQPHAPDAPIGCEEFKAVNSDEEDSVDSDEIDAADGNAGRGVMAPIKPLQPSHPLLVEGLRSARASDETSNPYTAEPDEFELVTERLKRPRPKASGHAMTARPAVGGWGFSFALPDRRQVRTADSDPAVLRPATAGSLGLQDLSRSSEDTASDLTCGTLLAGNPLAVARQRRMHASGGSSVKDSDLDIRDLLKRYQTYTQESCIPADELRTLRLNAREVKDNRPATPDVRISGVQEYRPASSGGSGAALARPGSGGSRRDSTGPGRPGSGGGRRDSTGPGRPGSGGSGGSQRDGAAPAPAPSKAKPSAGGLSGAPPRMPTSKQVNGAAVPQPTSKTSAGEVLLLDSGPPVDLE